MRAVVYTAVFIILQLSCTSALFNIPLRCFLLDVECTKTLVQNLVPSLSKSVDPMYIDFLRVDEQGFQGDLKNLTVTGCKNSIVDDVTLDLDKKEVTLQYHTDFTITGRYKASPLDPEADLSMLIRNIHITFVMPFEITQNANDYKFVYLSGFKYDYQIKENVQSNINDLLHHTFSDDMEFRLSPQQSDSEREVTRDRADVRGPELFCGDCGVAFQRADLLRRHVAAAHSYKRHDSTSSTWEQEHTCEVCGESCTDALQLLAHAERHAERPRNNR